MGLSGTYSGLCSSGVYRIQTHGVAKIEWQLLCRQSNLSLCDNAASLSYADGGGGVYRQAVLFALRRVGD